MNEDKKQFNRLLHDAGLNKKRFAELTGVAYGTITNWGSEDKPIPSWVASWLALYMEAKACRELKALIKNVVCRENE